MATNPMIWASFTTIVIIAPRIVGYWMEKRKQKQEKIIEPPKPKNERERERESTETPQEEKPQEPKPKELPKAEQVGFFKNLMRSG